MRCATVEFRSGFEAVSLVFLSICFFSIRDRVERDCHFRQKRSTVIQASVEVFFPFSTKPLYLFEDRCRGVSPFSAKTLYLFVDRCREVFPFSIKTLYLFLDRCRGVFPFSVKTLYLFVNRRRGVFPIFGKNALQEHTSM